MLNLIGKSQQNMLSDPEFRALRGAAKVMAGRYKEAETDFSIPGLSDDPASSLWRGYIAAKLGQWSEARQDFDAGASMLFQFPAKWRTRFATANAEAAIALNQYPVAEVAVDNALNNQPDPVEQLSARLVQAELFDAEGQKGRALRVFQAIAPVNIGYLAAPALMHATQIRLTTDQITPMQAAGVYDGLRYRWRGDATELDVIRALGQIYLSLGRYREALEALRSAGQRLPDLPQAVQLQTDLSTAFKSLFLDGQADGLQPVQALALFYDFKELTPIGADGDLMVRKLARRLVDVDLLQPGRRPAQVPGRQPARRRAAGRGLHRSGDDRPDGPPARGGAGRAQRLALDPVAQRAQRPAAGDEVPRLAGPGPVRPRPGGDPERQGRRHRRHPRRGLVEEARLDRRRRPVRTAARRPLQGARAAGGGGRGQAAPRGRGLQPGRGRGQPGAAAQQLPGLRRPGQSPDALRVALSGADKIQLTTTDFSRVSAENDSFVGWVQAMKQRFRDRPAPTSPTSGLSPPAAAPAKTASAGPSQG